MKKAEKIVLWTARIWGSLVLAVTLIGLVQLATGDRNFPLDNGTIALYIGNIIGLSLAYKWEGIGGVIAILGILISRFWHPLVFPPGFLYLAYWLLLSKIIPWITVSHDK